VIPLPLFALVQVNPHDPLYSALWLEAGKVTAPARNIVVEASNDPGEAPDRANPLDRLLR